MKKITLALILLPVFFIEGGFKNFQSSSFKGAWHEKRGDDEAVMIFTDGYFITAQFNQVNTQFDYGSGGSGREENGGLVVKIEFVSKKRELQYIGQEMFIRYTLSGNKLTIINTDSTKRSLTRIDDGNGTIAGAWKLVKRTKNGQTEKETSDKQKTLKILSGQRFQWATFNPETNEFIGSAGGTYSFKDNNYKERIEFYAKDPYKIGTSVSFTATQNKNSLTLKGKNSKGETIEEEWAKIGN